MNKNNTLNILYEDSHIIVCKKPAGIATQTKAMGSLDMENLIKRHIYQTSTHKSEPYVAVIHRLDQPVSGILVFAKTPAAARDLNRQLQASSFGKHYKAILTNTPSEIEQTLVNHIKKDSRTNTSTICARNDKAGKEARLHYSIITTPTDSDYALFQHCQIPSNDLPMVDIKLDTGRHHQIRVQMAHIGCPIWGDAKYGESSHENEAWTNIALCAYKLAFQHPITKKPFTFSL